MSDLDELARLVPPPAAAPPRPSVEADLPGDYLELVNRYGAAELGGIALLVPGHENENLDLTRQTSKQRWALTTLRDQGLELPYEPDELVPWAIDEAGNVLWWHAAGDWPVVANEARGDEWQRFDGGAVATLVALLSGRVTSDFLTV
jgi:hypothetical protein